jgi:hypothetical protein
MARRKCLTPGVLGLYVRMAKVALLSSPVGGGAKVVGGGGGGAPLEVCSTAVAYVLPTSICLCRHW